MPAGKRDVTLKVGQRFDTTTAYTRGFSNNSIAAAIVMTSSQTIGTAATDDNELHQVQQGVFKRSAYCIHLRQHHGR